MTAFFLLLASLGPTQAHGATTGQLDASPALFSVLAALHATGFDADLRASSNHPLREKVRKALSGKNIPVLPELRSSIRQHSRDSAAATFSLFVSFGLCVDGPPSFQFRLRTNELPPEVAAMADLPELMKRFYREAGIEELWRQAQADYEEAIARYHEPVSRAVQEANAYFRNPMSGLAGARFQIYLDLLGPPNQVHVRSYGNEYFVVVTASAEPMIDEIRQAYLQHLAAPLILRHRETIEKWKGLGDFAQPAPLLPDIYKQDFLLLVEKSLVKAIEARLISGPGAAERRSRHVERAMAEGFILTAFFAESLPAYEKQEQALRFYFPELIKGLDLAREDKRLETIRFATEPVTRIKPPPKPAAPLPSGVAKTLDEAENLLEARRLDEARSLFLQALRETDEKPAQAKAYFGLARIAVRQNDPELGERLFQKALELGPEPADKAWCLVYLGRLADIAAEPEQAAAHYRAALAVEGITEKAREMAAQGLKGMFQKKLQH